MEHQYSIFQIEGPFPAIRGRYVRRPPIAQRRITYVGEGIVRFWTKDKKLGQRVEIPCSLKEFIERWSQHILERYQHAVRSFGLFAPRALEQASAAIFSILGQEQRPRPKPQAVPSSPDSVCGGESCRYDFDQTACQKRNQTFDH